MKNQNASDRPVAPTVPHDAVIFAKQGWRVVPVPYGPMRPSDVDELVRQASNDPATVAKAFEAMPDRLIGVPLGQPSNTFVVRVQGMDGIQALHRVSPKSRYLPSSIRAKPEPDTEYIWFQLPFGYAVSSHTIGDGLDVLGEGEIFIAPPLYQGRNVWTYDPRWSELDRPPRWFLELVAVSLRAPDEESEGSAASMFRALDEAAYAQGAQREDTLFAAAHAIAATNEIGRLSNAEGYDQLLRAAEHNGLSRELRWFQIEPYLRAALTRKANSSMGRSK